MTAVSQVMSAHAVRCRPADTLDAAARTLWDADCGALPVVDDDGKLVGIVTDRDICMAAWTRGLPLAQITVAQTMTEHVYSVLADQDTAVAEAIMAMHQVRRLPVVDAHQRPIGIVTIGDLIREAAARDGRLADELGTIARTLAIIVEPRRPDAAPAR